MKTLVIILLVFGVAEIISNLIHLLKGTKVKIGESARKQHQELPLDAGLNHFFIKTVLMFILGFMFLTSSVIYLFVNPEVGKILTVINCMLMSTYGLIQIILYYRTIKVWTSFVVYSIPLAIGLFLL